MQHCLGHHCVSFVKVVFVASEDYFMDKPLGWGATFANPGCPPLNAQAARAVSELRRGRDDGRGRHGSAQSQPMGTLHPGSAASACGIVLPGSFVLAAVAERCRQHEGIAHVLGCDWQSAASHQARAVAVRRMGGIV